MTTPIDFAVRSSNSYVVAIVTGAIVVIAVVLIARPPVGSRAHTRVTPGVIAEAPVPAPVPLPVVAAGDALSSIGSALSANPEAANDVVFLTAAAAYGRCEPAHTHEFGVMAARARLPVLAGLTEVLSPRSASRAELLASIRELAARVPCNGPVDLVIAPFRQQVDIHAYAASFPDSYFDPALTSTPAEFAERSLADRAKDECSGVAYAVLPLDAPRAWQCSALRAEARGRVAVLCSHGDGADTTAQQIRDAVTRLPSTCQ